jgi:exopolysaccharide biosynthesis polyprenyl glycosylphosphotransferase
MKYYKVIPTLLLVAIDLVATLVGFYLAYSWRAGGTELYLWPWHRYWLMVLPFAVLCPVLFAILGLYPPAQSKKELERLPLVAMGVLCNWALLIVWLFFVRNEANSSISRLVVVYALITTFLAVLAGRWFYWYLSKLIGRMGLTRTNIFLITNHSRVAQNIENIIKQRSHLFCIKGSTDHLSLGRIKNLARNRQLDEVIILDPHLPDSEIFKLLEVTIPNNISVKLLPNLLSSLTPVVDNDTIPTTPLVEFKTTPLYGWGRFSKRIFDFIFSTITLVLLGPVFLIIALMIKIDSKGPVFYRHNRLGYNGKPLKVYKFRTMKLEYCRGYKYGGPAAEQKFQELMKDQALKREFETNFKLQVDPRVTRIGHLLRKTSLDELPQFINVLAGQLSLTGPRPIIKEEVDRYRGTQYLLWSVKPGLSGLWQVSGRSDLSYDERVKLDLFYIENWSPWLDAIITLKTLIQILVGRGAY